MDYRYFERQGAMNAKTGRAAAAGNSPMMKKLGGGLDKKARQAKYAKKGPEPNSPTTVGGSS